MNNGTNEKQRPGRVGKMYDNIDKSLWAGEYGWKTRPANTD